MKKLILMLFACVILMTLSVTNASAYPSKLTGWPTWPGSITVNTQWVGISNTDLKPTDVWVVLNLKRVEIRVANHGGNTGGLPGVPFFVTDAVVSAAGEISDVPLKGRGSYELPVIFSNQDILDAIEPYLAEPLPTLPNPNWYYYVLVWSMDVRIQGFTDMNVRCEDDPSNDYSCTNTDFEEVVQAIGSCDIQTGAATADYPDGAPILDQPYDCSEDFHWEYKNNNQVCTYDDNGESLPCNYVFPDDYWWQ